MVSGLYFAFHLKKTWFSSAPFFLCPIQIEIWRSVTWPSVVTIRRQMCSIIRFFRSSKNICHDKSSMKKLTGSYPMSNRYGRPAILLLTRLSSCSIKHSIIFAFIIVFISLVQSLSSLSNFLSPFKWNLMKENWACEFFCPFVGQISRSWSRGSKSFPLLKSWDLEKYRAPSLYISMVLPRP